MNAVAAARLEGAGPARLPAGWLWLAALAVSLGWAALPRGTLPAWALELPRAFEWPLAKPLTTIMKWLIDEASLGFMTVKELTRGLAGLLDWPCGSPPACWPPASPAESAPPRPSSSRRSPGSPSSALPPS